MRAVIGLLVIATLALATGAVEAGTYGRLTCIAKAAVDPQTREVFIALEGRIYGCSSCRVVRPKEKHQYFEVDTRRDGAVVSSYAPGASTIIRAYEEEIGGDPYRITMPVKEFVRRWKAIKPPGDWKEPFEPPKCVRR